MSIRSRRVPSNNKNNTVWNWGSVHWRVKEFIVGVWRDPYLKSIDRNFASAETNFDFERDAVLEVHQD
jgi:hypothetical protein